MSISYRRQGSILGISNEGGRWEFREGSSSKFWQAIYEPSTQTWLVEWGRIGRPAQAQQAGLDDDEAVKRAREKERKGYVYVGKPARDVGNRAGLADQAQVKEFVEVVRQDFGLPTKTKTKAPAQPKRRIVVD